MGKGCRMTSVPDIAPLLSDGVVTLRSHRDSDEAAIVEQCQDPESVRWTSAPRPYGAEQARAFVSTASRGWARGGPRAWAVEVVDPLTGQPRFAGTIDYRPDGHGAADLGFGLHPAARGHGVAARAVRLALSWAFASDGLQVVHWSAYVGNWPSRRTAWRCGFRVEGTVRQLLSANGQRYDAWTGSLAKGEPMEPPHRWHDVPVLEGERVRLRPWRENDAPPADPAPDEPGRRFLGGFVLTREAFGGWLTALRSRIAEGEAVGWCIADVDTDRPLGHIHCFRLAQALTAGSGMVGYWLHPDGRGRGAASEALELLVGHAFADPAGGGLGLHRLEAGTDADNTASARVLRRAGFTRIATEHVMMAHDDGPPTNAWLFELLASADREAARVRPLVPAVLEGAQVRLRPWGDDDTPGPQEQPDEASRRFMPPGAHPTPAEFPVWLAGRRAAMDAAEDLHWCIADRHTDRALGNVQLFGLRRPGRDRDAELGYWLQAAARGRGVMEEVLQLLLPHAFAGRAEGGLGLRRLHAGTLGGNAASQAVLERAGFTRIGVEHAVIGLGGGGFADDVLYELLAPADRRPPALEAVTLEGAAVRLRAWRRTDDERVRQACTDPVTRHWLGAGLPSPYTRHEARTWLRRQAAASREGSDLSWCVADPATDEALGAVSVMHLLEEDGSGGEIGYWAHPAARGRGVLSEAVRLAARHAFVPHADGGLGRRRLRLNVADGNVASRRVALRAGFVEVGRDRLAERLGDGSYVDLIRYDLLESEYAAR
jgi:RimJ/RimL family protein N-acetyltransferase